MNWIKILATSIVLGASISFLTDQFVYENYHVDLTWLEECVNRIDQQLPKQIYSIEKRGYPFYSFSVEPVVHESDCQASLAIRANKEMYGPYGTELNFLIYTIASFVLLGLFSTPYQKTKGRRK
jgi:hypothetical protein